MLAVIMLDDAKYGAGPGTVVEMTEDSTTEIRRKREDKDGCVSPKLRIWRPFPGCKVGDRVTIGDFRD